MRSIFRCLKSLLRHTERLIKNLFEGEKELLSLIDIAIKSITRTKTNITKCDPLDATLCMTFSLSHRYWAGMEEVFLGIYPLAVLYNCYFHIVTRFHNLAFKIKFQNEIDFAGINLDKHLLKQLFSEISIDKLELMNDLNNLAFKTIRQYNPLYEEPF
jgi:hypothetical protein